MKGIGLLTATLCLPAITAQGEDKKPINILLILSDDHSVPFLGCMGAEGLDTPNIDRIAAEGTLFSHAYTTAPQSVPSRASILTGRNVLDVEMSRFSAPLKREYVTCPELLREKGYYTGLCGRSYHLDGSTRKSARQERYYAEHGMITFHDRVDYLRTGSDDQAVEQFIEFLSLRPADKPFFIQVGFSDPHRKWDATEYNPDPERLTVPSSMPDTKAIREDLAALYGEIVRLDGNVGKLLGILDSEKLADNTLVIFAGDNGSAVLRGKGTLYRLGINVPLLVRHPYAKKGLVCDELVSGEDITPTILDYAGVDIPGEMDGRSFRRLIEGGSDPIRDYVFAVRVSHGSGLPKSSADFDLSRTIFDKKFKLIYNVLWQIGYQPVDFQGQPVWKSLREINERGELDPLFGRMYFSDRRSMFELYDQENDPNEFFNLSGQAGYAQIERELKGRLLEWMIRYNDYVPLPLTPMDD